jgi:hypothetical protein
MLQRDELSFCDVARRKRRDRLLQMLALGLGGTALSAAAKALLRLAAPRLTSLRAVSGIWAALCAALLGCRVLSVWEPGAAPADVLAKTFRPVADVISAENKGDVVERIEEAKY